MPCAAHPALQLLHSYLLTPYYGWKVSHHKHHMNHASMERDETWVPLTRSEMNIPEELEPGHKDFEEIFGDTPMYTLAVLVVRQAIAFPVYLRKYRNFVCVLFGADCARKCSTCPATRSTPSGRTTLTVSTSSFPSEQTAR